MPCLFHIHVLFMFLFLCVFFGVVVVVGGVLCLFVISNAYLHRITSELNANNTNFLFHLAVRFGNLYLNRFMFTLGWCVCVCATGLISPE